MVKWTSFSLPIWKNHFHILYLLCLKLFTMCSQSCIQSVLYFIHWSFCWQRYWSILDTFIITIAIVMWFYSSEFCCAYFSYMWINTCITASLGNALIDWMSDFSDTMFFLFLSILLGILQCQESGLQFSFCYVSHIFPIRLDP